MSGVEEPLAVCVASKLCPGRRSCWLSPPVPGCPPCGFGALTLRSLSPCSDSIWRFRDTCAGVSGACRLACPCCERPFRDEGGLPPLAMFFAMWARGSRRAVGVMSAGSILARFAGLRREDVYEGPLVWRVKDEDEETADSSVRSTTSCRLSEVILPDGSRGRTRKGRTGPGEAGDNGNVPHRSQGGNYDTERKSACLRGGRLRGKEFKYRFGCVILGGPRDALSSHVGRETIIIRATRLNPHLPFLIIWPCVD